MMRATEKAQYDSMDLGGLDWQGVWKCFPEEGMCNLRSWRFISMTKWVGVGSRKGW